MVFADIEVSPFLYIPYRPGVSVGGSVLVILAQSGYTREAILCVPTCRTASLIGKDSNGGLVELWDVLGKRKGRLTSICRIGNTTRVKALLRDHLVINTTDLAIALRTAATFGHTSIVELLVANIGAADLHVNGDIAVQSAARNGHTETVKFLLSKGVDATPYARSILRLAAEGGHLSVIELLISRGFGDRSDCEFLFRFATDAGYLTLVQQLLKRGVNIHFDGEYALRLACNRGHTDIVTFLINQGANIHIHSEKALWNATENGHLDIVKLLVSRGANVCKVNGIVKKANQPGYTEIANYLVSCGADTISKCDIPCDIASIGIGRIPAVVLKSNVWRTSQPER